MKIHGCTAVISGGSRGIGLGIARAFASRGASTILLGRDAKTLQEACNSLTTSQPNQVHTPFAMDVSNASAWDALLKNVSRPDILVNAAGVTHYSLLPRTSSDTINAVLATNLAGSIYGARAASKSMLKTGGCIINVASALAHRGGSGSSIYAASKAGLIGFTKALAEELGPRGVRCNAIAPGYIDTDMTSGMSDSLSHGILAKTAVRRIGTVEEVAHAAVFLAENDFMNGSTLTIDGGLTYD